MPVFHCSQYENGRPVIIDLVSSDDDAFLVPEGATVELHCRKVDDNIVTLEPDEVDNNTVTFKSTEQLTACPGDNLCEVVLYADTDPVQTIATLNFILHVEPDPLEGGLTSETQIYNLTQQVEEITQQVIGDDYYNKTEVDDLLDDKADQATTYTKSEVDTALNLKADKSTTYTKSQVDSALALKADVSDLPDMTDYYTKTATDALLDEKADADTTYTKSEVDALIDNIFPTFTVSGNIATFTTALTKQLVSITTAEGATTVTRCGVNLLHVNSRIDRTDAQVHYTSDDNYIYMNGTKSGGGYADMQALTITLPVGTYYLRAFVISGTASNTVELYAYDGSTNITGSILAGEKSLSLVTPTTFRFRFAIWHDGTVCTNYKIGIVIGTASISNYSEYIGTTVPVADADTLTTIAGVNNIYADSGEVTVQYKYMSM
jgi:hypothetical protein